MISPRRTNMALMVGVVVALAVHIGRFVALPCAAKFSYLPDDAFYYFQLGREHARSGLWSFDRGVSLTSGFHLVQGWFASFVEYFVPGEEALNIRLSAYAIVGGLLTAVAMVAAYAGASRAWSAGQVAAQLLVGFAGGIFILPMQAMEWPFAVLATSLAFLGLMSDQRWLFVIAMLVGPACRFDFVLFAGALCLAALTEARALDPRLRRTIVAGGAAVTIGTLLVMAHTWSISGHLLQSSARMKGFWGSVNGYQPLYGLEPSSYAFAPAFLLTRVCDFGPATLLVPMLALAVGLIVYRRELAAQPVRARLCFRASVVALVLLPLAYGRFGTAAQCWYSALFVIPMYVVVSALAASFKGRVAQSTRVAGSVRVATAAFVLIAVVNAYDARRPVWRCSDVLPAFRALAMDKSIPRTAAWNAGTSGYLGGERTLNIDGLVNDDVYPYIVADRIHCYLVHEHVPVIVDSLDWFEKRSRMLGGQNGRLHAALRPRSISGATLEAYDVDLAALAADPACAEDLRSDRSKRLRPYR